MIEINVIIQFISCWCSLAWLEDESLAYAVLILSMSLDKR